MDTLAMASEERRKHGSFEAEFSFDGEIDLHRHLNACEKNPGHLKFVPVDQFNKYLLPAGYHENILVELVRVMSNLTVRVSLKYGSDGIPESIPGSDKLYSLVGSRDRMMVGSGSVKNVIIFPMEKRNEYEICNCKECLNSPTPKTQFAYIYIRTAAHLVPGSLEGAHTTCHLFFDRGGAPNLCDGVIKLDGLSFINIKIIEEWCEIKYVTHDLDLANRLGMLVRQQSILKFKIDKKYEPKKFLSPFRHRERSRPVRALRPAPDLWEKLTIIVSHPHGCSKQISIGQCTHRDMKDMITHDLSKYTYTTATCSGSIGASIYVMGWGWPEWYTDHVHRGNSQENKELNYSCYAAVLIDIESYISKDQLEN